MNREKLIQYRDLRKEIEELEKKLSKLKSRRASDTVQASNQDFPFQPIRITVYGMDSRATERTENAIERRYRKCQKLRYQIDTFINQIPDSRTRQVFELRYIDGYSWIQISRHFGSRDESYSRKIHDRYLDKL